MKNGYKKRIWGKLLIRSWQVFDLNMKYYGSLIPRKINYMSQNNFVRLTHFVVLLFHLLFFSCKESTRKPLSDVNTYQLTTEKELENKENVQRIEEFYESGESGYFNGKENVPIYYNIFEQKNAKKAIYISSGYTEAALKYKEVLYDLFNNGYSIYINDHRGQGLSGRLIENAQMGYIDSFQYFIEDMKYIYDHLIANKNYDKIYLLAHSMGGAIGMTYIQQNPQDFNAAAFSSPMLGFKPTICGFARILHDDEPQFAIGQSEYKNDKIPFEDNDLTGSKIRYQRMIEVFKKNPNAQLGGATYKWLLQSCEQFEYLFDNIDKIQTPFVLFSAEHEDIVDADAIYDFFKAAKELNKVCEYYSIENTQHELLIEKDKQRIQTINTTLDFFSRY